MAEYSIEWTIDVTADDETEAAARAWDMIRAVDSTACVFEVSDEMDMTTRVDLAGIAGKVGPRAWVPNNQKIAELAESMDKDGWSVSEIVEMIRRPHKYAAEYTAMIVEREFGKVAKEPEQEDDELRL
jgi:hypothetical protein